MASSESATSGADKTLAERAGAVLLRQEVGLLIVVIVIGATIALVAGSETITQRIRQDDGSFRTFEVTRNRLLNADVLVNYLKDTSFVAIMAVGMTAVIITAGIDLSIGGIYALAGVVGAMVLHYFGPVGAGPESPAWGTVLGIAAAMGVAGLCGLFNGLATVLLRLHPFIITLGTMLIFRGIAFVSTGALSIGDFPTPMTAMIKTDLGLAGLGAGIGLQPVPVLIMLVVAGLGTVYLGMMVAGRHVYAVGGNIEASRFSGLRTGHIVTSVYVAAGLCAGIATIVANGVYGSATCSRGEGYELKVIAAAVVGGASLTGGRGTAIGAVLGAMLIQLIDQAIVTMGINQNYNQIVIGSAIVVAVVIDRVSNRATARRLAARARKLEESAPAGGAKGEGP